MQREGFRQIHMGARFAVFRGEWEGEAVVVKAPRSERGDALSEARLRHEYALLTRLHVPYVARTIALDTFEGRLALILSDAGPLNLDAWLRSVRPDVGLFLQLAERLEHRSV